ncbi:uncharacterized protein [Oryctolagus cuniculus]|uniref:uncharacterized protein n=1 Tax=Oryctolagus cuniculus TaxID=9986 RepID=UPI003879A21F
MLHPGGQGGARRRAPRDWPAPPQGSRGTSAADARLVQVRLGWTRQLPERVLRCPAPTPGSGVQRAPLPWAPLSAGPSAPLGRPPEARTLAPRSGWLLRGARAGTWFPPCPGAAHAHAGGEVTPEPIVEASPGEEAPVRSALFRVAAGPGRKRLERPRAPLPPALALLTRAAPAPVSPPLPHGPAQEETWCLYDVARSSHFGLKFISPSKSIFASMETSQLLVLTLSS